MQPDRDHIQIALGFARAACRDRKRRRNGLLIQQASRRFLEDMKRARKKSCPFFFDPEAASRACQFIELLPHVEGKWKDPNLVLHPSHLFLLVQLFGFRKREGITLENGRTFHPRRFNTVLFAVARKNAKSTLAAAILLYCFCTEPEEGAQVITAATTYSQAQIILHIARRMVQRSPGMVEAFGIQVWSKSIIRPSTGSRFEAIHAKASSQDGLNPSHVALDEIHAHKTPDLLNVLSSAQGGRFNPLWLYTTTEGYENPGPWRDLREFSRKILGGVFKAEEVDHFLAIVFALDNTDRSLGVVADDDFKESAWIKANPLLDVNPHLMTAIRTAAVEARSMPSKLAEFRIKRLNRPASVADGWVNLQTWRECSGEVDLARLRGVPCWGGLDLASTSDLCAFRLVWWMEGQIYTWGWRWVPEQSLKDRSERGAAPFQAWREQGWLISTPGNVTDYSAIEAQVIEALQTFDIQLIAYDRWNASDLINRLMAVDAPMVEFVQGPKSYHPAMQALERAYMEKRLHHGGDPVLSWCASNLVARLDQNLNMAPDRKNSSDKIDDFAALLMAVGVSLASESQSLESFIADPIIT